MEWAEKLWSSPPKEGRALPGLLRPFRPSRRTPRFQGLCLLTGMLCLTLLYQLDSFYFKEPVKPTPCVSLPRHANLSSTFARVAGRPGKEEAETLLGDIKGHGVDRLREIGVRAREYKHHFKAWEELHLFLDGNGHGYVRHDLTQQLRQHFVQGIPGEQTRGELAQAIRSYEEYRDFMTKFGQLLFPWTAPYFPDHLALHSDFQQPSRGIVLTAGDAGFTYLHTSIRSLRKLGCTLPIEVMYAGDSDLGEHNRAVLEQLDGVITRNLARMVNNEGWRLAGWFIKPFAILLSSFREVIFIDADSLFFRDPRLLFDDPAYRRTGALFFKDRMIHPKPRKDWLQKILPPPISGQAKQSRFWTGQSAHMQESGVVVVDKWRHIVALLMVTRMNGPEIHGDAEQGQPGLSDMIYGDKETFWLGWEMVGDLDYAFHEGGTGSMGVVKETDDNRDSNQKPRPHVRLSPDSNEVAQPATEAVEDIGEMGTGEGESNNATICAPQLLHLGLDGRPLWFNGWVIEDKFVDMSNWTLIKPQHFLTEPRDREQIDYWEMGEDNMCCHCGCIFKRGVQCRGKKSLEHDSRVSKGYEYNCLNHRNLSA